MFFHAYMYGPLQGKLRLYGARKISSGSIAMSTDWEVFASMLVNDLGSKLGTGVDLTNYEVKSAKAGGGYEYQYHKYTGREKLAKDMEVGHLFFEYWDNLKHVELRYAHGSELRYEFFEKWLKSFPDPYPQRYRKQVSNNWVREHGKLLMTLHEGEVIFPKLEIETPPTTADAGDLDGEPEEESR